MNPCTRVLSLAGAKKAIQEASVGAASTSQKVWSTFTASDGSVAAGSLAATPPLDGVDQQQSFEQYVQYAQNALMAEGAMDTIGGRLQHVHLDHAQLASLLNSPLTGHTALFPQPSPSSISPEGVMLTQQYLSRQGGARPFLRRSSQPTTTAAPEPPSSPDPIAPTIEQQIHALPKHLLDSDSESEGALITPVSQDFPIPAAQPDTHVHPQQAPTWKSSPSHSPFHSALASLSLHHPSHEPSLSHAAAPFVPRRPVGLAHGVATTAELLQALQHALSLDHLHALLLQHHDLIDSTCIVIAMRRLVTLYPSGPPLSDFHRVAHHLASLATTSLRSLAPHDVTAILSSLNSLQAPITPAVTALTHAAAQHVHSSPSLPALQTLIHALRCAAASSSAAPAAVQDDYRLAAGAAAELLASTPLHQIPAEAVGVLSFAMHAGNVTAPDAQAALGHAVCMHAEQLSVEEVIVVLQQFVGSQSSDTKLLGFLARAFHVRCADWDVASVLTFLSMCRSYKPLLAAQRQHSTLVAILDYLQSRVALCSTPQLATVLLDLAFIGCQSFKAHPILSAVSDDLYQRISVSAITTEHAVELADAIRALDKLDHCHDGLSSTSCAVLAGGYLPAKHLANVVVSLAKQKHLAPLLADSARDLLGQQLASCNGQDVSQLLFGLVLDKAGAAATLECFASIAPALASQLRSNETFQAQAVSRILSSYAKVGCFAPAIFDAGVARLSGSLHELKPAFVAELAWSLAVAERGDAAFMRRIGGAIKRRFSEYSPAMLCSTLWAFAQTGTFHPDLFNLACSKLTNLLSRGQLAHQDVVQIASGIAKSQFRHPAMLRAVHEWLLHNHTHVPASVTAPLLSSLHTFGNASDRLLSRLTPALLASLPSLSDRGKLVQIIWACTTRADAAKHAGLAQAALQRFNQCGGGLVPPPITPQELAMLAIGLGGSAVPGAHPTLLGVAQEAYSRLGELSTGELVKCVVGVTAEGLVHAPVLHGAAPLLAARSQQLSSQQLCDVAVAFSDVGLLHPPLFQSVVCAAQSAAAQGSLSCRHAAALAWAVSLQGMHASPVVRLLCQAVKEEVGRAEHEAYHLRRSAPALSSSDLCRLHLVGVLAQQTQRQEALADASWQLGSPPTVLPLDVAVAARAAHDAARIGADSARKQDAASARALSSARDALRRVTGGSVTTRAPDVAALRREVHTELLELVDLWSLSKTGQPVGVILLSPLSPLGTSRGQLQAVVRSLRHSADIAVLSPDQDDMDVPQQIREQLQL